MNTNRWISGIALGALLLAQTLPAQASRMLCGMKDRPRVEVCSRCDDSASTVTGGALRARSCCRVVPSEATETAPVIVSAARRIAANDGAVLHLTPALTVAGSFSPNVARFPAAVLSSSPFLESAPRTTDLRN